MMRSAPQNRASASTSSEAPPVRGHRGTLRRHRHRHPPLAAPNGGRRFWPYARHVRSVDRSGFLRLGRDLQPLSPDLRIHFRHEMRSGECGSLHMSTGARGAYAALKVNTDAPISNRCRSFTHPPFEGAFVSSITSCHGALPFSFLTPLSSNRARPSDISPASPTLRGKHQASAHVFSDAFAST
jgi:hypothetical protein